MLTWLISLRESTCASILSLYKLQPKQLWMAAIRASQKVTTCHLFVIAIDSVMFVGLVCNVSRQCNVASVIFVGVV